MIFPPHLRVALLQTGLSLLTLVSAATNYTVDDLDPLFHYSTGNDGWLSITTNLNSEGGNLDYDGSHMLSLSPNSSATISYTFANVYFLAGEWSYPVTSNYAIDGNLPMFIDMQDHSVPTTQVGLNGTKPAGVVGYWKSNPNMNQQHTILITVPPNQEYSYAVVDAFIFEVLDPISSTSQTSSSTGTTTGTTSSSSLSSSVSPSSSSSSASHGFSATEVRELAISMAVVGTLLALLLIFLLLRFCIRRKDKDKNQGGMESLQTYHPVPNDGIDSNSYPSSGVISTPMRTASMFPPINNATVPLSNSSSSMRSTGDTGYYGGIQNTDMRKAPIVLNYDPSTSSSSSPVTAPVYTQPLRHHRQADSSTPLMVTDDPPVYSRTSTFDESSLTSNEKAGIFHRSPANTLFIVGTEPEDNQPSTSMPGRHEEHDSVWDSGYPKPLKFLPIT